MDVAAVETAIVNRLKAKITGLAVEPFPGNVKDYALMHPAGAVLVHYAGSVVGRPERRATMIQKEELRYDVTLVMRNLRKHDAGAYAAIEKVKAALLGWKISGCGPAFLNTVMLIESEDSFWWYVVGVSMMTALVVNNKGSG